MSSHLAPQAMRKPKLPIAFNVILSITVALLISLWGCFDILAPYGSNNGQVFPTDPEWLYRLLTSALQQTYMAFDIRDHFLDPIRSLDYFIWLFERFHLKDPILWRIAIVMTAVLMATLVSWRYTLSYLEARSVLTHLRGRQFFTGKDATRMARAATKQSIRKEGRGIKIAPKVPISLATETKHFLLVGASGSGKTQILFSWIKQLLGQGSKLVLHDTKGDLTSSLPVDDFILLAPHDERSWCWNIAQDCQGIAAARELAARLVPEGKEPMWSNGAREILIGIIKSLQASSPGTWTWKDLRDTAYINATDLKELLDRFHPEGAKFVEVDPDTGIPNKTSFSFLVSLWSNIGSLVGPLALAWESIPEHRRISLTEWLKDDNADQKVLILQRSAEFDDLSKAWIGAAIQLMANFAASPSLSDSRSRRIWLFLDEFAQMGKIKGFHQFLEVGRSRGIRSVIGLQDLEQLKDLYGEEALKTWLNTIETKIICRMNAGPSASYIAKDLIGDHEVSWREESRTHSGGSIFNDRPATTSSSSQVRTATTPVLFPDYLERNLGRIYLGGETIIRALVLLHGDVIRLDWPLTSWPEQRPGSTPASWTKA